MSTHWGRGEGRGGSRYCADGPRYRCLHVLYLEVWSTDSSPAQPSTGFNHDTFIPEVEIGGPEYRTTHMQASDYQPHVPTVPNKELHYNQAVLWIRINWIRIRIRIQGFDDQILKKSTANFFFLTKIFHFTYPQTSIKDVNALGEASSPQKRTSSTSKMKFINFFLFLQDPDWGSVYRDPIESGSNPNPQPWHILTYSPAYRRVATPWCQQHKWANTSRNYYHGKSNNLAAWGDYSLRWDDSEKENNLCSIISWPCPFKLYK